MIIHPDDRIVVYDTVNALIVGRRLTKKVKQKLAHRLIVALGDEKAKAAK